GGGRRGAGAAAAPGRRHGLRRARDRARRGAGRRLRRRAVPRAQPVLRRRPGGAARPGDGRAHRRGRSPARGCRPSGLRRAGVGGAVSAPQVAGVLLVGAGLLAVAGPARPGRRGTTDEPPGPMRRPSTAEAPPGALVLALATGAAIASYTLVDRAGLRHAD